METSQLNSTYLVSSCRLHHKSSIHVTDDERHAAMISLFNLEGVCSCCTLFVSPGRAPDLSSSVITPPIGNFRTAGTNVKIGGLGGTPIETCTTET